MPFEVILGNELRQRLGPLPLLRFPGLLAHQQPAQEIEYPHADGYDHRPYGSEGEETERLHAGIHERLLNNQVGRGTDQGKEPHAAGEGHGHQVTTRTDAGRSGHAHHDGHHDRHRPRIAHEGPYECRHEHHEDEKHILVLSADTQNPAADHLGQTRTENTGTDHEQPHHHDHHRTREPRERLGRGEDAAHQQGEQGAQRHDIGPDLTAHEEETRNEQNAQSRHRGREQRFHTFLLPYVYRIGKIGITCE